MSRFFDSDVVRESLKELDDLQKEIFKEMFELPFFSKERKKEHLGKMKLFLEKQKNFIFRISLSDDPDAIEMKNAILESAQMFGIGPVNNVSVLFEKMEKSINALEDSLDD
jgi:hypothetical protein